MRQFFALLAGLIGAAFVGWVLRRADALKDRLEQAHGEQFQPAHARARRTDMRTLRHDPVTGRYRPD